MANSIIHSSETEMAFPSLHALHKSFGTLQKSAKFYCKLTKYAQERFDNAATWKNGLFPKIFSEEENLLYVTWLSVMMPFYKAEWKRERHWSLLLGTGRNPHALVSVT